MLYVFYVNVGQMLNFEIELTLASVQLLKTQVELQHNIPSQKQILLVSGGRTLQAENTVCSYHSGTDTSPLFLFNRLASETGIVPPASFQNVKDVADISMKAKEALDFPPTFATVESRTKLAKTFQEIADDHLRWSAETLHEQHLQQQGWAAVIAHLDDLSTTLMHRWSVYKELFQEFISQRNFYVDCLNAFKDDVLLLQKIPLLPALIESQKLFVPDENNKNPSLFDWIIQQDSNFMDHMFDICTRGLSQNDEVIFRSLEAEVEKLLRDCRNKEMKEIKGLGDRLSNLDELMANMKRLVKEQGDLAQSFERNHTRAAQIREPSVLPDLCATHVQQLTVLDANNNQIRDMATRLRNAKKDLCEHLNLRLGWLIWIEDRITDFDNTIVRKFQQLRTLQHNLEILQQIHSSPMRYVTAVAEVIRRRRFSQSFLVWASDIACNLLTIYSEELSKRKEFQAGIDSHFLSSLFTGMEDTPPAFATQAPPIFDSELPKLTEQDIDSLRNVLPELEELLNVGDVNVALNFFMPKDSIDRSNDNKAVEDKLIEVVAEAGLASNLDQNLLKAIEGGEPVQSTPQGLPHLKDIDRGCESETDTEEFEKVGQSPFDLNFDKGLPTSPRPGTQDASTLTEDNLQISRSEHERVKSVLVQFAQMCALAHNQLKTELVQLKDFLHFQRTILDGSVDDITAKLNDAVLQRERESIQRITVDHELEISDFRKIAQGKNEEIKSLRDTVASLRAELAAETERNREIETRFNELAKDAVKDAEQIKRCCEEIEADKVKQIKDVTEELNRKHKAEIENMRCRFKLMTMERSPSENSLEKIERGGESSSTEAILLQMRENFESAKEVAVSEAVSREDEKWQKVLAEKVKEVEARFVEEKTQVLEEVERRISKEKDRQIEILREQMRNVSLECVKHKSTIQQLTEQKDDCRNDLLKTISDLEAKIVDMGKEAQKSRSVAEMGASVAVFEDTSTSDVATSPIKMKRIEKKSELSRIGKLSTDSCKPGEIVLIIWDSNYKNFKILQESSYLFFLNADSFESLGIKILEDGSPNKSYCFAEVIEKEYCHARKDEQFVVFQPTNRYRVPQGTKFFRVKAKATGYSKELPVLAAAASSLRHVHMTQSQTTPSVDVICSEEPSKSLPSSPTKESAGWGRQESSPQPSPIPEEKGEDSVNSESTDDTERHSEDIEKGTELTENFNVEYEQPRQRMTLGDEVSIDRSQICVVA